MIAIILLFVIALRMRGRAAQIEFAEIKGRLSAMAEIAAQQNSEQLRGLNERIDTLAHQLGQPLDTVGDQIVHEKVMLNDRTQDRNVQGLRKPTGETR